MDKNKLLISISILLSSIILGGFIYSSQINKQESIERQQMLQIEVDRGKAEAERQAAALKLEKEKGADTFSNNLKCQTLLKDLKQRWNNVVGIYYGEYQNTCIVKYTIDGETQESAIEDMQDSR